MLNFPDAPAMDETFVASATATFRWKGNRWRRETPVLMTLTQLLPNQGPLNNPAHQIELLGLDFTPDTDPVFDGVRVPGIYFSATRFVANPPVSTTVKSIQVVMNDPVKGNSNALTYNYRDPLALYFLFPAGAPVNTTPSILVVGAGFTAVSVVHVDGVAVATTFIAPDELMFNAPTSATVKVSNVTVIDAGTTVGPLPFNYITALPAITLTTLQPNGINTGPGADTIVLFGTGFTADCGVMFGSRAYGPASITLRSPTEIHVMAPRSDIVKTDQVFVRGIGRDSNALPFNYTSVTAPVLNFINPDSILAGGQQHLLNYMGSNFNSDAVAYFDDVAMPTTRIDATRLDITVTAPIVGTSKNVICKVLNPASSEFSNELNFSWTATATQPVIHSAVPNYMVKYFSGEWEIVVQSTTGGMGSFTADAVCYIDGVAQRTQFYAPGTLRFWCIGSDWPLNMTTGYPLTVVQVGGTSAPIPFYNVQ